MEGQHAADGRPERPRPGGFEAFRVQMLAGFDDARDRVLGRPAVASALVAVLVMLVLGAAVVSRLDGGQEIDDSLPVAVAIDARPRSTASSGSTLPTPGSLEESADEAALTEVVVHVAGAVAEPGVYRLGANRRVEDAVLMAGGLLPDADPEQLNLAALIVDGTRIHVPKQGDLGSPLPVPTVGPAGVESVGPTAPPQPVDVNSAGLEELVKLPGIGPATASAIIEHRAQRGPFVATSGLLGVSGIGPAKLAAISDRIVVR